MKTFRNIKTISYCHWLVGKNILIEILILTKNTFLSLWACKRSYISFSFIIQRHFLTQLWFLFSSLWFIVHIFFYGWHFIIIFAYYFFIKSLKCHFRGFYKIICLNCVIYVDFIYCILIQSTLHLWAKKLYISTFFFLYFHNA